jgi:hypothetical protein
MPASTSNESELLLGRVMLRGLLMSLFCLVSSAEQPRTTLRLPVTATFASALLPGSFQDSLGRDNSAGSSVHDAQADVFIRRPAEP